MRYVSENHFQILLHVEIFRDAYIHMVFFKTVLSLFQCSPVTMTRILEIHVFESVVSLRCKPALVNCFFSFNDFVYYQGGHSACMTDIKTCSVIISVKYYSITTSYRTNIIEVALIQCYRKSS